MLAFRWARWGLGVLVLALLSNGCGSNKRRHGGEDGGSDGGRTCAVPASLVVSTEAGSTWDLGWNGIGHGLPFPVGSSFAVAVEDCDQDCRTCSIRGPIPNVTGVDNRRCTTDTSVTCTTDEDCPAASEGAKPARCTYLVGPALTANGQCTIIEFAQPGDNGSAVEGQFDLATGALSMDLHIGATVSVGEACALCRPENFGDDAGTDGGADGGLDGGHTEPTNYLCVGGPKDGQPCRVDGYIGGGALSYDCPVEADPTLHSEFDIKGMSSAGTLWVMDEFRPKCTDAEHSDESCWCGLCSDRPVRACGNDRDCGGTAKCGAGPDNAVFAPNGCDDDGACVEGRCGGDPEGLRCFPSGDGATVRVTGVSSQVSDGEYSATIAAISCVPPTSSAIDILFGIPGPVRVQLNVKIKTLQK